MNGLVSASFFLGLIGSVFGGPNADLRAAVTDLTTEVAVEQRSSTRYLSFSHLPAAERASAAAAASFVLNSVSRADLIVPLQRVPRTDDRLWRFSLHDYRLPAETWEKAASRDPYWHLRTQVAEPVAKATKRPIATVFTDGGWLDLTVAAELREASGSGGALLRGDFFLALATTTLDDGLYYELAGIPETEREFFQLLGVDIDRIDRLRADEGANLIRSQVTFKTRRIVRRQGPLGGAWHTYDTNRSSPDRDPLRNPFAFEYDAGEHIAAKRNGLHLYALFDAEGRRQASVPDVIAKDASDPHGTGIVVPMISCVRCHIEDGLRPFANDQRRMFELGAELFVERPSDAQRLASFYLADLNKRLLRDREDFASAVAAATGGRTTQEIVPRLARVVHEYADQLVDLPHAAAEVGVSEPLLQQRLRASHDSVLAALAVGIAVQREQWEASFGEAALLVRAAQLSASTKE